MSETSRAGLKERLHQLTAHLEHEHPELLGIVQSFRRLDKVAHRLGLLERTDSYATQVTWWPLISVLGTFSSGKSTFINALLGQHVQPTGNQAVDDKFTVICYGREDTPRVLPGLALDSDPRFPFYKISHDIDEAMAGEGQRLDRYLQLKTCHSEQLRGKIIIDSPGFDADAQRTSTLRITNHIVDLSDLVLVFFDARHPEPGAMQDTLEYLVAGTLQRPDFGKFLHILNQIDNAAREDNPEEVFAAWQRALAAKGLTSGNFYRIYDPSAAVPIENEHLKQRFEEKRVQDMDEILERIDHLEVERAYRVAGKLEHTAQRIRDELVPRLEAARRSWKRRTFWLDGLAFGAIVVALLLMSNALGWWEGLSFSPPWLGYVLDTPWLLWGGVVLLALGALWLHRLLRRFAARAVTKRIRRDAALGEDAEHVAMAFEKNVRSWWPFFLSRPLGWGVLSRRRVETVLGEADKAIQHLNDRFASPSGGVGALRRPGAVTEGAAEPAAGRPAAATEAVAAGGAAAAGTGKTTAAPPPAAAAEAAGTGSAYTPTAAGVAESEAARAAAAAATAEAEAADTAGTAETAETAETGTAADDDTATATEPAAARAADSASASTDEAAEAPSGPSEDASEGSSEDERVRRTGTHDSNGPVS